MSVTDNKDNQHSCISNRNTTHLDSYILSGRRGTHCGGCGVEFQKDSPVFRYAIPARWLGIYITDTGPICEQCANTLHGNFEYIGKCGICEKPVYVRSNSPVLYLWQRHVYCCENHRQQLYRDRIVSVSRVCQTCGDTFTPKRNDSKYCSSKCRQKAYRERKA